MSSSPTITKSKPPPASTSPSETQTASQIFASNPLPAVRTIHKNIHTSLEEKNVRLRGLVGGSYRQLLGTAELIVTMRSELESVENRLAHVAKGCGRGEVGRRVTGLGKLGYGGDTAGYKEQSLSWLARMKVLDGAVLVVGRVLRGREVLRFGIGEDKMGITSTVAGGRRLVTAAKILVLARLLIKSLGDEIKDNMDAIEVENAEELLEDMRKKLGGLRRRLLRSIERVLQRVSVDSSATGDDRSDQIEALCAYSLATSSGAKDVLRHFLHVRGEAMALVFDRDGVDDATTRGTENDIVLKAFNLYTKTLLDVQALVPRVLADALLSLKGKPLLQDETIRSLEGLRLDISDRWFGEEFKFFTPYIRHEDLDGPQAVTTLKGWAKRASELLLQGFEKTLAIVTDFKGVVDIRTRIFEMWNREGGKAKGFDSSVMLDGLRKVINSRLVELLEARVGKLHLLGTEIEATLATASATEKQNQIIWDEELLTMELSHGATSFKQAVVSRVHGRTDAVSRVVKSYEAWRHLVNEMISTIEEVMKKQRWDDDLDSLEDDLSLENRNTLLSKEDPEMLQELMDSRMESAFESLFTKLASLLNLYQSGEGGSVAPTIFMIRVLRDLRSELPDRPASLTSFGLPLIPKLHTSLAQVVSADSIVSLVQALRNHKRVPGRGLWEGSPPMPIYPSPAVFKFVHSLTSAMADAGPDLWSPTAVVVLKKRVDEVLRRELAKVGASIESSNPNQDSHVSGGSAAEGSVKEEQETSPSKEKKADEEATGIETQPPNLVSTQTALVNKREMLIQILFDVHVLKCALGSKYEDLQPLGDVEEELRSLLGKDESDVNHERLVKSSQQYWMRSRLLFGLLL